MKLRILAVASVALAVVACSSKKSSSSHVAAHDVAYTGPTTPVVMATVDQAVAAVGSTTAGVEAMSANMGSFTAVAGVSAAPAVSVDEAVRLASRLFAKLGTAQVSGVRISDGGNCEISGSGSMTGEVADVNNPGATSGDWGEFTLNNCENAAGQIVDGVIKLQIVATNGVDFTSAVDDAPATLTEGFQYRATITFTDLTFTNASGFWTGMDGNVTETVTRTGSQVDRAISGTGLVYGVGQGTQLLDGSMLTAPTGQDGYADDVVRIYGGGLGTDYTATLETRNSKLCSIAMGGCVQVVTNTPVHDQRGAANPDSGSFTITAGSKWIRVDIQSATDVNVTYDIGSGQVGPVAQTWACLRANTCTWN